MIADDLRVRGAAAVHSQVLDINDDAGQQQAVRSGLAGAGTGGRVLVAHGTLPDQAACESSAAVAVREFNTNATATIALLTRLAPRMQAQGQGSIAVISSVAGDRGRASNYRLRQRQGRRQRLPERAAPAAFDANGVNVLTIKPGFVDTPMTAQFKKGALWATPTRSPPASSARSRSGAASLTCRGSGR